jgi:MoaA/NifB/PqqE/SkfB family radical SAM enzyme
MERIGNDSWQYNRALNTWEYATGKCMLHSYPIDLSLTCVSNVCNADCVMCNLKEGPPYYLSSQHLHGCYGNLLKYCCELGLVGWGEPLLNPNLKDIFSTLQTLCDERCNIYLSTNGLLLAQKIDLIKNTVKNINVSLNAASQNVHSKMMRVNGKFNDVLDGIKIAIEIKEKQKLPYNVNISLITTKYNLFEIPEIIHISEIMRADSVIIRPLHDFSISAFRDNRHDAGYNGLHPEHLKEYENLVQDVSTAIKDAGITVISTDPRFPGGQFSSIYSTNRCFRPHTTMIFYRTMEADIVQPCCFMADNQTRQKTGYPVLKRGMRAEEVWNSKFYINLRKSFQNGKLLPECAKCQTKM